jgi:AcrR family transcriptional regulator
MRSLKSSIESIATCAGGGKTTIYRRWESKEYLIIEAFSHLRTEMPILDTGNLREDLFALLRSASQVVNPVVEQIALKLIGEIRSQPQLYPVFQERLIAPRLRQIINLIERAKARGELR